MLVLTVENYDRDKGEPYVELRIPPSNRETIVQVVHVSLDNKKIGFIAPRKVEIVRSNAKAKF